MLDFLGSLISSGTNYFLGKSNQDTQKEIAAQNIALQKEFAQQGISWKVADAKNAGIHPLAALGAQTSSFSPVSVGTQDMSSVGQDLGRAVKALSTEKDREDQAKGEATKIALQKGKLENEVLKTEVASRRARLADFSGQVGPPVPIPRPGPARSPSGYAIKEKDLEQTPDSPPSTAGYNLWGFPIKTRPGWSDAQTLEDRGGEWAGDVLGIPNIPADVFHTMGQSEAWKRYNNFINTKWGPDFIEMARGGDRSRYSRASRNMRGR